MYVLSGKTLKSCLKSGILNGLVVREPTLMFYIVKKECINFHSLWISLFTIVRGVQYFVNITVCTQAKCLGETLISVYWSELTERFSFGLPAPEATDFFKLFVKYLFKDFTKA